jgi:flagellar basal-body rod protein FlgF
MLRSMFSGVSGLRSHQTMVDVIGNNIANVNTAGFKTNGIIFSAFLRPGSETDTLSSTGRRPGLDNMSWQDMSQGTIQQTGGPLDVAIDGDGMLVVQTAQGERYTRNGALQISNTGEIVTLNGDKVLGDNGPIILQPTDRDVVITKDGTIKVREGISLTSDSTRGRLRLVTFADSQALQKDGSSTFAAPDGVAPQPLPEARANVVQGAIEKSNVQPVIEMTRMIELTRAYTEVAAILQQQNDLQKNSLQQLAEVPA